MLNWRLFYPQNHIVIVEPIRFPHINAITITMSN